MGASEDSTLTRAAEATDPEVLILDARANRGYGPRDMFEFIPPWALGVGVIIIAGSVARALAALLRSPRGLAAPRADAEVAELRQTVDSLQQRLGDVEERLDFAERLLAKQRDADRLGSPPR